MTLHIIKIGGNIIDHEDALKQFIRDIAGLHEPFILVHGGGKLASALSNRLGIETKMTAGRRITDQETLEVVTMVYAGLINKKIVVQLQALGCNAIGLCGADANIIRAKKRQHPDIDFGFVGDPEPEGLNAEILNQFIKAGLRPVIAPITHDQQGQLLNTNADTIASFMATGMADLYDVHLHYCFEKTGVLSDVRQEDSVIPEINTSTYIRLKEEGIISEGMIPKLDNAFAAIRAGVKQVSILHALHFISFISKNGQQGTRIVA
jgi:acetylglutamate kinase